MCAGSARECGAALETLWALCGVEPLYFGGGAYGKIRPADNKMPCHKFSLKTKAVRRIFAHSIRTCTVCCSEGIVSILSLYSVNRDCPLESESQEHNHKQLSIFVFALLSREKKQGP